MKKSQLATRYYFLDVKEKYMFAMARDAII